MTTSPIVSELQNRPFATTLRAEVNGVDLNYQGNAVVAAPGTIPFIVEGTAAIKNKVLFWLSSVQGDYPRESTKGGILYSMLGRSMTSDNVAFIKNSISTFFTTHFQEELHLIDVSVVADVTSRKWNITLYVQDPIRRELFNVAVGVSV